jgi:hypothetical protein
MRAVEPFAVSVHRRNDKMHSWLKTWRTRNVIGCETDTRFSDCHGNNYSAGIERTSSIGVRQSRNVG